MCARCGSRQDHPFLSRRAHFKRRKCYTLRGSAATETNPPLFKHGADYGNEKGFSRASSAVQCHRRYLSCTDAPPPIIAGPMHGSPKPVSPQFLIHARRRPRGSCLLAANYRGRTPLPPSFVPRSVFLFLCFRQFSPPFLLAERNKQRAGNKGRSGMISALLNSARAPCKVRRRVPERRRAR